MDNNFLSLDVLHRDYIAYLKTCLIDSLFTVQFVIKAKICPSQDDLNEELENLLRTLIEEETKRHSDKVLLFNKNYTDFDCVIKLKDDNHHIYYKERKERLNYPEMIDSIKEINFGNKMWLDIDFRLDL